MSNVKIGNRIFNGIEGVVLNNVDNSNTLYSLMDWGENTPEKPNYVKNRPFWSKYKAYTWNGDDSNGYDKKINNNTNIVSNLTLISEIGDAFVPEVMIEGNVQLNNNIVYPIIKYVATLTQFQHFMTDFGGENVVGIINGQIFQLPASASVGIIPITQDNYIMIFAILPENIADLNAPGGLYAFKYQDLDQNIHYLTNLNFNDIIINKDYEAFFKYYRNPMYVLPVNQVTDVLQQDLSSYQTGDLILLVTGNPL